VLRRAWVLLLLSACSDGSGGGSVETFQAWSPLGESAWGRTHLSRADGASSAGGGITSGTGINVRDASVALDAHGRLFVGWQDEAGINIDAWSGSRWIDHGPAWGWGPTGYLYGPSFALDSTGTRWVAWADESEVYVKSWSGSEWVEPGTVGAATPGASVREPRLALDPSGDPIVAWMDDRSGRFQALVKKWNGTAWVGLGGSDLATGISGSASSVEHVRIAADSNGYPIVAWTEGSPGDLFLRRWNGSAWVGVKIAEDSSMPSLAVNGDDLYIAWTAKAEAAREIYLRKWNSVGWSELNGSSSGTGVSGTPGVDSDEPSLALLSGSPVVGWRENGGHGVYVKRWDGASWVPLAESASGTGLKLAPQSAIQGPSLGTGPSGGLAIAWITSGWWDRNLYVRTWDGSRWNAVEDSGAGGLSHDASGESWRPALAMDPAGNPVVAWEHMKSSVWSGDIYVRKWNGGAWVDLGGSTGDGGISGSGNGYTPAIAVDAEGNPIVAWQNLQPEDTLEDIYVKRWDGSAWVGYADSAIGGGVSQSGGAFTPSIAVDGSGRPVVAWLDEDVGQIYLKKWDGTAWVALGDSASGEGISKTWVLAPWEPPGLAVDAFGSPVVAWRGLHQSTGIGSHVFVKRWNGSEWVGLGDSAIGGGINSGMGAEHISMAADSTGGFVVAWEEDFNTGGLGEIHLKRWTGSAWEELAGSATGGGVSRTSGESMTPSVAVDGNGNPVVAWHERTIGGSEVYVKVWDGSAWVEFREYAASGGGVSNSHGYSQQPAIAVRRRRTAVAWTDWGPLTGIYLRQTMGP